MTVLHMLNVSFAVPAGLLRVTVSEYRSLTQAAVVRLGLPGSERHEASGHQHVRRTDSPVAGYANAVSLCLPTYSPQRALQSQEPYLNHKCPQYSQANAAHISLISDTPHCQAPMYIAANSAIGLTPAGRAYSLQITTESWVSLNALHHACGFPNAKAVGLLLKTVCDGNDDLDRVRR